MSLRGPSVMTGVLLVALAAPCAAEMEHVRVSDDGKGFVLAATGRRFVPWGSTTATRGA